MTTDLLEDFLDIDPFAIVVKRHPRTVRRWLDEADGLPYTRIGNRILIHIPTAREWIMNRMRVPNSRSSKRGGHTRRSSPVVSWRP
jgi:hypothetical protein